MNLRITQECDYAFRIMLYLSCLGEHKRMDAVTIAETQCIPQRFAIKILRKLTLAGLVNSYKGVKGGYSVGRHPSLISLKDVSEIIDGPQEMNRCLNSKFECGRVPKAACPLHSQLCKINQTVNDQLSQVTFDMLVSDMEKT